MAVADRRDAELVHVGTQRFEFALCAPQRSIEPCLIAAVASGLRGGVYHHVDVAEEQDPVDAPDGATVATRHAA